MKMSRESTTVQDCGRGGRREGWGGDVETRNGNLSNSQSGQCDKNKNHPSFSSRNSAKEPPGPPEELGPHVQPHSAAEEVLQAKPLHI